MLCLEKLPIEPMIKNILEILNLDNIDTAQFFSIEYLIHGLIIAKISYLVEAFRNRLRDETVTDKGNIEDLFDLEVAGNA